MAKISKDEYEILKGLDDRWKWIARDRDMRGYVFPEGGLWLYEYKPERLSNFWSMGEDAEEGESVIFPYNDLFQFIQLDDSEPYNIQELIDEYEDESEEAEMKKDKKWLNNEVTRITNEYANENYFANYTRYMISDIKDAINQLDELEQPVELQELIEKYSKDSMSTYDVKVEREKFVNDLLNLLVPKQELPVIPQSVADWIESRDYYNVCKALQDLLASGSPHASKDVRNWIFCNRENAEKFVRAWLDGFTAEEEQKYVVKLPLPGHKTNDFAVVDIYGDIWIDDEWPSHYKMTEKEIKALPKGEVYFEHFAVKAEELEE